MKKLVIALSFLILSCGCGPKPDPSTPPPATEGDACEQACAAWTYFAKQDERCIKEASDTKEGKSCTVLCREVESSGFTSMNPQCIPKANSCMQAKEFSSKGCE